MELEQVQFDFMSAFNSANSPCFLFDSELNLVIKNIVAKRYVKDQLMPSLLLRDLLGLDGKKQMLSLNQRRKAYSFDCENGEKALVFPFYGNFSVLMLESNILADRYKDRIMQEQTIRFAHQLKTSLATILSAASLMERYIDPGKRDNGLNNIGMIFENSNYLLRTIDNMLESAKYQTDTMELAVESVDVCELIFALYEYAAKAAAKKGIKIEYDVPQNSVIINGDADKLNNILINVVENAINHTDENGRILISLTDSPDSVCFRIKDNGCGIPSEVMEKLFDLYFTTAPVSSGGKSGLGLFVAKAMTEKHRGTITAKNLKKGAQFKITIPKELPSERAVLIRQTNMPYKTRFRASYVRYFGKL